MVGVGTVLAISTMFLVVIVTPPSTLHPKRPKALYVPSEKSSPVKHIKSAPTTPSPYFTSLVPIGGTNPMPNPWSNKVHPAEERGPGGVHKAPFVPTKALLKGGLIQKTSPMGPFDAIPVPSVTSIVATAIHTGDVEPSNPIITLLLTPTPTLTHQRSYNPIIRSTIIHFVALPLTLPYPDHNGQGKTPAPAMATTTGTATIMVTAFAEPLSLPLPVLATEGSSTSTSTSTDSTSRHHHRTSRSSHFFEGIKIP